MKTYHLHGVLRTLEPFSVTLSSKNKGIPKQNGIGYLPQSTLNGRLRKCALAYIIRKHKGKENTNHIFNLDTFFSQAQGYIINNDLLKLINTSATSTAVDEDLSVREANPFLSLFGRWKLSGKWGIGNAYTTSTEQVVTLGSGNRSAIFERDTDLLSELPDSEVERYITLQAAQSALALDVQALGKEKTALVKKLKTADEDEKAVIRKEIGEIEAKIEAEKSASKEGRETILRPLDDIEVISAFSDLSHRMTLSRGTVDELGCLLAVLGMFSTDPRLGAKKRANFGLIEAEWDVSVSNEDTFGRDKVGKITINDDGFKVEGEELEIALKTFCEGIASKKYDFSRIA